MVEQVGVRVLSGALVLKPVAFGAELKDGLREGPSWIAFARENGAVYHT